MNIPWNAASAASRPKLRVLFLATTLEVGGTERQLSQLAPLLRDRGFDPAVVTLRSKGPFFDILKERGIGTRFLPVRSRFDVTGVYRAIRDIGSWPQLVISVEVQTQIVGQLVAWHAGAAHLTIDHKAPEARLSLHRRLLTKLAARWIDVVIAVSEVQVDDLVSLGFRRDRIEVIENGVCEPEPTRAASEIRRELGLGQTDFVALLAATLWPEKRASVFVKAVLAAHKREPRIRGVVAGGGPDFENVRRQTVEEVAVTALGERADVADLMLAADVVCLTSRVEALPMVILEAMAMGRPVIATRVGGVSEAVIDGKTGILLALDDGESLTRALVELAADPAAASAMGAAGRQLYEERFSAELMADRYASALANARDSRIAQRPADE